MKINQQLYRVTAHSAGENSDRTLVTVDSTLEFDLPNATAQEFPVNSLVLVALTKP